MSDASIAARGPLWARPDDDDHALPFWQALLIAALVETLVPILIFGVDWSFLPKWNEPEPIPVMSVKLDQPPPEPVPPRPKIEKKPKPLELPKQVEVELPKPLPNQQAKLLVPKVEEKPKPKPKPKPKDEEKPPEPDPQPEVPELPSVFRDVKPVRKVKPVYPREAEDQKIGGRVRVRLSVDVEGNVTATEILLAEPPGVFDEAVLTAVKQYKFKKDGSTYQADQEIIFKIDE